MTTFKLTDAHRVHLIKSLVREADACEWTEDALARSVVAVLRTPAGELENLPDDGIAFDEENLTDAQQVMLSIDFFGIPEDLTGWDEPVARG